MTPTNAIDLMGQAFGRLRVTARITSTPRGTSRWQAECAVDLGGCGRSCAVVGAHLRNGTTRSCGCLRREVAAARQLKHGGARRGAVRTEFETWGNMIGRCEDPKCPMFPNYGGRGITVCAEWRRDFAAFFAHVGPKPSPKHSIDRIDNDRGYEPGNVRWATATEQSRNRRCVARITAFGETLTAPEWAERTGISAKTIAERYRNGMGAERALAGKDLRVKGLRGTHRPRRKRQPPEASTSLA